MSDAVLHRIEALPGAGRYAVTFRRSDGSEQTTVATASGDTVDVAEASLPIGWTRDSEGFALTAAAVRAVETARNSAVGVVALRDVDGGWDVSLGNVVLGTGNVPECTAHGPMQDSDGVWTCAECGARAAFA